MKSFSPDGGSLRSASRLSVPACDARYAQGIFATYTPPQKADFIFNKEPLSWVWHTLRTEVSAVRGTRYHRMHYVRLPRRTRALIWLGLVCLLVVGVLV